LTWVEDAWDWLSEELSGVGDSIIEAPQTIGEFFSNFFDNIGEFSIPGVIFGLAGIFLTRIVLKKLDWINALDPLGRLSYSILLYAFSFIITYL